jgi:hypothetical protein
MTGRRAARSTPGHRSTGPSWLRFGCLLAVGEVVMLGLVVVHPGAALGARSAADQQAASVGHTGHASNKSRATTPSPTATLPVSPPTTVMPAPVAPTTLPPPATPTPTAPTPPASTKAVTASGVLPANIPPQPNFLQSCSGAQYDDSQGCVGATLQAIDNGRGHEGLPPMVLPSNWAQLSPEEQIFVSTNLERTARGMPPMAAMATGLDQAAARGASQDTDPGPPGGFPYSQWGSNWAGAVGNPLEAMYFWMYDDGTGSANVDCTSSKPSGCWGHRENVLVRLSCTECLMGTGWVATGYQGDPSMTELLVETSGNPAVDFTWRQESTFLS